MKNFVKAINEEGDAFQYLKQILSKLSDAKLREGIFVRPQITKIPRDEKFDEKLRVVELVAWRSFKTVKWAAAFENTLLTLTFKFFSRKLSDEQGERFHQDLLIIEQRYQSRWNPAMMGDYCWFLKRETDQEHKRK